MLFKSKKYRANPFNGRSISELRLTFCITHKNREAYLKQTLAQNLRDNKHNQNVDFVLVDFNDNYSMVDWLKSEFKSQLADSQLKAYHSEEMSEWHASKAKNCAHMLAEGDILVNLDCDNFTGPNGGDFVMAKFIEAEEELIFWQNSRKKLDGTYGRIAIANKTFHELGGYNEAFLSMGFQDGDLIKRAKVLGLKLCRDVNSKYNEAIQHEKFIPEDMTWKRMNEHNEKKSKSDLKASKLVANDGVFGSLAKSVKSLNSL